MNLGFTGTRVGLTGAQRDAVDEILAIRAPLRFHHGDCVGSDAQAHDLATERGIWTVGHPPKNPKSRAYKRTSETRQPKDYLVRNRDIVDETDFLLACPGKMHEEGRGGTWATIRHARALKRPITIVWRDGSCKHERMDELASRETEGK